MPSSNSNGSQTCTISTEHTLATITAAGTYVLTLDLNAMAADDVFVVRQKLKVRSVGTTRILDEWTVGPIVTPEKVWASYPVPVVQEIVYTITQTAGTGRAVPWEIVQL